MWCSQIAGTHETAVFKALLHDRGAPAQVIDKTISTNVIGTNGSARNHLMQSTVIAGAIATWRAARRMPSSD
ncbi:hypothetical protein HG421_16735 [Xanthomonas campestris pv. badrii]|uniref:Uncharacterized protein n=1 Tax=Xanthomonas campestris pv. badrii TaxID=149696 RepID=A0A7Z2VCX9_XANCA|nr:hypothetical protein [Xanthomonas campestris]MCC4603347.1 hypothetical protein [Xanthomonas campestris pv. parthenii]QJD69185.1 hypothetical protein HG421_16735 [Xanthomonas campestris pv. badrii]